MRKKLLLSVLYLSIFFIGFSNKSENNTTSTGKDSDMTLVNSLVQTYELLKVKINSPMMLGEYTAEKNDKNSLIESVNSDIIFIPNKGQIIDTKGNLRPDILYKASLNGADLYLTNKGMSFVFYKNESKSENHAAGKNSDEKPIGIEDEIVKMYRMDMDIVGINHNISLLNEEQTEEYFNYYYAHCPEGITNIYGYKKVVYKNVYDNIDLVYYSNMKGLKYDFIVKPGGDVSDIKLKYNNEDAVYITEEGKIRALNPFGEVETDVLYTYQTDGKLVESNYIKDSNGTISIKTGEYDRDKDLIIDPYIGATFYGGYGYDNGFSITTNTNNDILVTGRTTSPNFPTQDPGGGAYYTGTAQGIFDVYILKFNQDGIRQWATFYGGSWTEMGYCITADGNNNILVTGEVVSLDFPTFNPGGTAYYDGTLSGNTDAFILRFDLNGVRQWATYYGGSSSECGYSITTDGSDNIFVTGETSSADLPVKNFGGGAYYQSVYGGASDAFVLMFLSNFDRQWATYYGGSSSDYGRSITKDGSDNIFVTGYTYSYGFPLKNLGGSSYWQSSLAGGSDVFILKFNSNYFVQWATFYGGPGNDYGYSITTDNSNILVSGYAGTSFPLKSLPGAYNQTTFGGGSYDAYILRFNSTTCYNNWATYYGGSGNDYGYSICADGINDILVVGNTYSTDFPTKDPGFSVHAYFQNNNAGDRDAFIAKFTSGGYHYWGTYYGGSGADYGYSITTTVDNFILVTGGTYSTNFPIFQYSGVQGTGKFHQGTHGGGSEDAFMLGFFPEGVIGVHTLSNTVPDEYALHQNYPNPFNPKTNIRFDIRKPSHTKMVVYDIHGKEVTTLVNEKLGAGSYEVEWNGSNFASGVYLYKLITDDFSDVKKMILVK